MERMTQRDKGGRIRGRSKGARIFAVEMLRMLAIVGIAIFHTFLPAFESVLGYGPWPVDPAVSISAVTGSLWAVWLVMLIKFVGAWGNHIFFMISGYFLIPRMMRDSREAGYWRRQSVATARRVTQVLATVAFYTLIMLVVDRFVAPVASDGWKQWLLLGLEFIWIYALVVALAPAISWMLDRMMRRNAGFAAVAAIMVVVLTYALNAYVAFTSTGSFGLLDWRKWVGALSYTVSFVLAGLIGCAVRAIRERAGSAKTGQAPLWMRRSMWAWTLAAMFVALAALVLWVVARGDYPLLYRLSFKSTSMCSFLLAVCALMVAVVGKPLSPKHAAVGRFRPQAAVEALASGILGFYVVQSLAGGVWKPLCERVMAPALAHAAAASDPARAGWLIAWFAIGIAFSVGFVIVVCVCDRFVRQPLLRALKLVR